MTDRHERDRGFALLAVLLVLAMLGVLGAEFAFSMRLEASAVRAYKDLVIGAHLAEAAVEQAIREIVGTYAIVGVDDAGVLTFYKADGVARPRLSRGPVPLGEGEFRYEIRDEESLVNLNTSGPDRIERLLTCRGLNDKSARDTIVSSIQDWRDANEDHRANGAESEDTYLKRPVAYRSRNGNLDSVRELVQINGVTRELYEGTKENPGLAADVTVKTGGAVNMNTASETVLCALGLSPAEIGLVVQTRREKPYLGVPGQFGGRGLAVTGRTFRIEAEGLVNGRVGARITAVVSKRDEANVVFLEWSGPR